MPRERGTRRRRYVALASALVAVSLVSGVAALPAAAQQLTGKRVRRDARTGALRALTAAEARELVTSLTDMSVRAVRPPAAAPVGAMKVEGLSGLTHLVVWRPNPDGTTSLRCVSSVEEAVAFLSGELSEDR
jgi:hypothetical protein